MNDAELSRDSKSRRFQWKRNTKTAARSEFLSGHKGRLLCYDTWRRFDWPDQLRRRCGTRAQGRLYVLGTAGLAALGGRPAGRPPAAALRGRPLRRARPRPGRRGAARAWALGPFRQPGIPSFRFFFRAAGGIAEMRCPARTDSRGTEVAGENVIWTHFAEEIFAMREVAKQTSNSPSVSVQPDQT